MKDKNKALNKNGLPPSLANIKTPIPEVPGAYRIKELQITIGKLYIYEPYRYGKEILMSNSILSALTPTLTPTLTPNLTLTLTLI